LKLPFIQTIVGIIVAGITFVDYLMNFVY